MVRMYRYMGERTLMALSFLKGAVNQPDKTITNYGLQYRRNMGNEDPLARIFYDHFDCDPPYGTPFKLEDLIQNLQEQVLQLKQNENEETGSLIERAVNILGLPYARNQLSGRTIDTLRRALLLPQELANTGTALTQRELSCVSCGRTMRGGEMASIHIDHGTMSLMCFQCFQPTFVACRNCGEAAPIDRKFWKKNFDCGCMERKEKEKAAAAEAAANPAPAQINIDAARAPATQGQPTAGIIAAPPQQAPRTIQEWMRTQRMAERPTNLGQTTTQTITNGGTWVAQPNPFEVAPEGSRWRTHEWVRARGGLPLGDRMLPIGAEAYANAPLEDVTPGDVETEAQHQRERRLRATGVHIQDETGDITGAPILTAQMEQNTLAHLDRQQAEVDVRRVEEAFTAAAAVGEDFDEGDDGDGWVEEEEPFEEEEED